MITADDFSYFSVLNINKRLITVRIELAKRHWQYILTSGQALNSIRETMPMLEIFNSSILNKRDYVLANQKFHLRKQKNSKCPTATIVGVKFKKLHKAIMLHKTDLLSTTELVTTGSYACFFFAPSIPYLCF